MLINSSFYLLWVPFLCIISPLLGQECTSDDFAIVYNGSAAFKVKQSNGVCSCSGGVSTNGTGSFGATSVAGAAKFDGNVTLSPGTTLSVGSLATDTSVLRVFGKFGVSGSAPSTALAASILPGGVVIGDTNTDYGRSSGWTTNTAGLLMECADYTELKVHDFGTRLASVFQYAGPSNTINIGRDVGSGTTNVNVPGVLTAAGFGTAWFQSVQPGARASCLSAGYCYANEYITFNYPVATRVRISYRTMVNPAGSGQLIAGLATSTNTASVPWISGMALPHSYGQASTWQILYGDSYTTVPAGPTTWYLIVHCPVAPCSVANSPGDVRYYSSIDVMAA